MSSPTPRAYEFGPFRLEVREGRLTRLGDRVPLRPKAFDALLILISERDGPLSKDELFRLLWGDAEVEEQNLTKAITAIRKALADDKVTYIQTHPHRGYQFVAEVREDWSPTLPTAGVKPAPVTCESLGADPDNPPWVGPGPYTDANVSDFFGRDSEIKDLVQMLSGPKVRKRVVLLYSPSGAGKSSLINAGVRPQLLELANHQVLPTARVSIPTADPMVSAQNPFTQAAVASMESDQNTFTTDEPVTWVRYLTGKIDPANEITLILDQLEEIVTATNNDVRPARAFFIELREALERFPRLSIVLVFREEYLASLRRLGQELSEFWVDYQINKLHPDMAAMAIRHPANGQGVEFAPDEVLKRLVGQLCDHSEEFVEPLQLQLVCRALWKRLHPGQRKISWDDLQLDVTERKNYDDGYVPIQAVSRFVDSVLHDFCNESVKLASAAAGTLKGNHFPTELVDLGCRQFLDDHGRRTLVQRRDEWTGTLPKSVVDELVAQKFLRIERYGRETLLELAHDTLIKPVLERARQVSDDSLRAIYANALNAVSASDRARRDGINENLIAQEFRFIFVGDNGVALQVPRLSLESVSARLPLWAADVLVDQGLLRRIAHEGQEVYEVTHRRIAQMIHRERTQILTVDRIDRTRKVLATQLDQRRAPSASPGAWFQKSDSLLKDIEEVFGWTNLSSDEAKLVICASLRTGYELKPISTQIAQDHSALVAGVLQEALTYLPSPEVRCHAATALGWLAVENREQTLLSLALDDPAESVQQAAAATLAELEGFPYWNELSAALNDSRLGPRAYRILAWINDALPPGKMRPFAQKLAQLGWFSRLRMRFTLGRVRWQSASSQILLIWLVAYASTVIVTVPPRMILAFFDLTTTQVSESGVRALIEGMLNGVLGVTPWVIFIGGGLLFWWYVVEGRQPWSGRLSALIGAIGGLIGGVLNAIEQIFVYGQDILLEMGWITRQHYDLSETLFTTGAALLMPVFGTFVGLAVGLVTQQMLPWRKALAENSRRISNRSGLQEALGKISVQAIKYVWLILLPMLAGGVLLWVILRQLPHPAVGKAKLLGEAISLSFGGFGLVVGLFLGGYVLRKVFRILGRESAF